MGEAKRRRIQDPSYGKTKRGLIVSPPVEIEGSTLRAKSSNLDPQELRFSLLFWDKLVWPSSRAIHFASGPDEEFLESAGVLQRPDYTFNGDGAAGIAAGQIKAFVDFDKREPGLWSLAQGENSLLIRDGFLREGGGIFLALNRAIPIPDRDVPLLDILEFKRKRYAELLALREELDCMAAEINDSSDSQSNLVSCISKIESVCTDVVKASREAPFRVRLSDLKVSVSVQPVGLISAISMGAVMGQKYNLEALGAALGGLGSVLQIGTDSSLRSGIRQRQRPYRYVYRFHKEVF